jgi:hypothetical protein
MTGPPPRWRCCRGPVQTRTGKPHTPRSLDSSRRRNSNRLTLPLRSIRPYPHQTARRPIFRSGEQTRGEVDVWCDLAFRVIQCTKTRPSESIAVVASRPGPGRRVQDAAALAAWEGGIDRAVVNGWLSAEAGRARSQIGDQLGRPATCKREDGTTGMGNRVGVIHRPLTLQKWTGGPERMGCAVRIVENGEEGAEPAGADRRAGGQRV